MVQLLAIGILSEDNKDPNFNSTMVQLLVDNHFERVNSKGISIPLWFNY